MIDFEAKFHSALSYEAFIERYGTAEQRKRWSDVFEQFELSPDHKSVLGTFVREMNLLCLAGTWCGDCVLQCPLLETVARHCPAINLRFTDRDADDELAGELTICGGARVPTVVMLSEDFKECLRYGDRTLSRYRTMTSRQLGDACPTGLGTSDDELREMADDWLRELERVQLMLRLSPRLRERHGD